MATIAMSVSPWDTGGLCIQSNDSILVESWLQNFIKLIPSQSTTHKVPFNIDLDSLIGGVDIAKSLLEGRMTKKIGILEGENKKILILRDAEKISNEISSCLCNALDFTNTYQSKLKRGECALVTINQALIEDDDKSSSIITNSLNDRLGIILTFPISSSKINCDFDFKLPSDFEINKARERLAHVNLNDESIKIISTTSLLLGLQSMRPVIIAGKVARIIAAYEQRFEPNENDLKLAIRLVIIPRATQFPNPNNQDEKSKNDSDTQNDELEENDDQMIDENLDRDTNITNNNVDDEKYVDSIASNIPESLLKEILSTGIDFSIRGRKGGGKKGFQTQNKVGNGKLYGVTKGQPNLGNRLNILETIKAAIPHQTARKNKKFRRHKVLINIESEDFRIYKRKSRQLSTTIFLVDASGSSAANRLGEAKGAVELLLAQCYIRRDKVAVITFRNKSSDLVLPPTRSLVKVKKTLAGLPGGGGTPLSAALDDCKNLIDLLLKDNQTPVAVVLSDGGANICRDGKGGRVQAHADALDSAKQIKTLGTKCIFIDTGVISSDKAISIASSMGAKYFALPRANSYKIIDKITQ